LTLYLILKDIEAIKNKIKEDEILNEKKHIIDIHLGDIFEMNKGERVL